MSYASIMVAMDLTPEARDRVRVAGDLADFFRARLIGVAADQPDYTVPPVGPTPAGVYALADSDEVVLNDLRLAHAAFDEAAGARSRVAWRSNLDFPLPFLVRQAAGADLVVLGRGTGGGPGLFSIDTADAIMRLGRPVLVVPPGIDHLAPQRIAIGWKNTREARRAVRDALPFLKRALHVDVIAIDDGQGAMETREVIGFLHAQQVAARIVEASASGGGSVADALMEAARERAVNLIVAGAYGHGRLREWAFGGVTRSLLTSAPVCCLMSH
ncbi:universal stress protein [Methylobacterium persicinum]|uniref:Nucleotide-binding universal stress UspA family protein n=1 Tax=Methylobacterium persicinum TaxID=374426 RepID=A0ABU0HGZ1_9HYPH|nr:universal stress protein [Methylobacterium persicinum]MDQ0441592.1 nucleotide-binding universal stress UspA family protein [Methylobacterium persicinum]GJE39354.1 hypothetical protein KHHGKMAE_3435 [Methylobacterium persicinum]